MVLYRRYRPQTIADLDSERIRTKLTGFFSLSSFPHALLFTGPKGTGKTSAARIVAKILNCEKNKKKKTSGITSRAIEPCNVCEACLSITQGRNMDVLEIDAASNRGIDEIRELKEKVKLAPIQSSYTVYVIDEVHMLTNEAFNALLKTLEEPPVHAVFILATTEPNKLLPTIRSRCVDVQFYKATTAEITRSLARVVKGEKLEIADDVLEYIAEIADGSFRDATKYLEQAIAENARTGAGLRKLIEGEAVTAADFLALIQKKNIKESIAAIQAMERQGVDLRLFISRVLSLLHDMLLVHYGVSESPKQEKDERIPFSPKELLSLLKCFEGVYAQMKSASNPVVPIEIAVVEWIEAGMKE